MNASALQDRHAFLYPEQWLARPQLRHEETRPAAIARMRSEQLGQGGAGRCRQTPRIAQPAGELINFGRTASAAGDQGKACSHTTHNIFVLLLFFSRESGSRVNPATRKKRLKIRFLRGIS
jgi:hypothetical protein